MQPINFYDEPPESSRSPEDVRLKSLGLYVHEDGRRVAVGFDITPFQERPSPVEEDDRRQSEGGDLAVPGHGPDRAKGRQRARQPAHTPGEHPPVVEVTVLLCLADLGRGVSRRVQPGQVR